MFLESLFKKVDFCFQLFNLISQSFYLNFVQRLSLYSFLAFFYFLSISFYDPRNFLDIRHKFIILLFGFLSILHRAYQLICIIDGSLYFTLIYGMFFIDLTFVHDLDLQIIRKPEFEDVDYL